MKKRTLKSGHDYGTKQEVTKSCKC